MQEVGPAIAVGLIVDIISVKNRVAEPVLFSSWSKTYHEITKTKKFRIRNEKPLR